MIFLPTIQYFFFSSNTWYRSSCLSNWSLEIRARNHSGKIDQSIKSFKYEKLRDSQFLLERQSFQDIAAFVWTLQTVWRVAISSVKERLKEPQDFYKEADNPRMTQVRMLGHKSPPTCDKKYARHQPLYLIFNFKVSIPKKVSISINKKGSKSIKMND